MNIKVFPIIITLITLMCVSCASTPKENKFSLSINEAKNINRVCILNNLKDKKVQIFDTSGIRENEYSKSYGGVTQGAIGGLIEGLIIGGIAEYKLRKLVDEPPSMIDENIDGEDIKRIIENSILEGIDENRDKFGDRNITFCIKNIEQFSSNKPKQASNFNYLRDSGYDLLVIASYTHGLSVTEYRKPIATVMAVIEMYDTVTGSLLARRPLNSRSRNDVHTVKEYIENDSKLYVLAIQNDAKKIGELITMSFPRY